MHLVKVFKRGELALIKELRVVEMWVEWNRHVFRPGMVCRTTVGVVSSVGPVRSSCRFIEGGKFF